MYDATRNEVLLDEMTRYSLKYLLIFLFSYSKDSHTWIVEFFGIKRVD